MLREMAIERFEASSCQSHSLLGEINFIFDRPVGPTGRMPLARYESIDETLKTRILDVSKQEFAAHGYEGASYNKIIQTIGISKGSMYYYFENKEDLFITCFLDEALASGSFSSFTSFTLVDDQATFWDSYKELSSEQWMNIFQHPLLMSLVRQTANLGADHPIVRTLYAECEGLSEYADIMRILEHGVRIDAIRDDIPLSVLLRMSSEYEFWLMQEMQEQRLNEQQVVSKFFEMFKQLFETRR